MHNYWSCAFLFRIILPCTIAAAVFIRPTITSYIYMIMGCYMPFFSVPTSDTMKKGTGFYMKMLLITCILNSLMVVSSYFSLFFFSGTENELEPCSTLEKALRTLGVVNFGTLKFIDALPWCIPEPLMLITSFLVYLAFKKMCHDIGVIRGGVVMKDVQDADESYRKKMLRIISNIGKYLVVFLFCLTAVLKSTVFGGIYYLVFLTVMTYWACNKSLGKLFARLLICLIPIIFFNVTMIFFYQFQYFQDSDVIDTKYVWGRLIGLGKITTYKDCEDPRIFQFHGESGSAYVVPISLFFLYYSTVLVSRQILQAKDGFFNIIVALYKKGLSKPSERWDKAKERIVEQLKTEKYKQTKSTVIDKIELLIGHILQIIIDHSYLTANFIMMIWGIAYAGWKAMILLLWANLIWLLPFRKKVMLASSPVLVAWVWFLLITNYLFNMDLTEEELPHKYGFVNFSSGVILQGDQMWLHLLTKSLFGVIIFVTMRQLFQERAYKKQRNQLAKAMGLTKEEANETLASTQQKYKFLQRLQSLCYNFFAIWWIWVVIITMIWMEFWAKSNCFRIAFVGLAILFIMTFQLCPFNYWKKFLKVYWWIVIVYAMFNLFVVYLYQIREARNIIFKYVSEETFKKYGFQVRKDRIELFSALLTPIFFQIAVVIQKNYLQAEFDRRTSPLPPDEIELQEEKKASKWKTFKTKFSNFVNVMFAILELHMQKIILLIGWFMCIFDLCALFVPFVLLFTVSCIFKGVFVNIVSYTVSCLVQILILLRLLYMNIYSDHEKWNYIGYYERNGKPFNKTLNTADWLGFHQSSYGMDYADFGQLQWSFFYVFTVTMLRIIQIRMKNYRRTRNLDTPFQTLVLFPEINYKNCHENAKSMIKFLLNYGFYKLGIELTLIVVTIVMTLRMDVVAIALAFYLLFVFSLSRKVMRIIWLPTLIVMAIVVPIQYLVTLGFWPSQWESTLTGYWSSKDVLIRIQQFCYFANMAHPPNKTKITLDFWFLLFLSRQWQVFQIEKKYIGQYHPAGSNDDVSGLLDADGVENPVPDFMTYSQSYLDIFKRIFFTMWFYAALMSTFLAGTMRPTLFSFAYIVGAFIFMWEGTDLYLRPPKSILRRWNILLGLNIIVMVIRTVNQIFGCILRYETSIISDCTLFKVFSIGCVDKYGMTAGVPNISKETRCEVEYKALGLAFDCICFIFLIFQQRIFKSYHFFHMINTVKAHSILSDRGAELLEEQRSKKRKVLDLEDETIKNNIKQKLEKIRATHQRVQGDAYARRKKNQSFILKSSDYYMFDDASLNNDIPLELEENEKAVSESYLYDPMPLTKYFQLFHETDIATVIEERALRKLQKKAFQDGKNPDELRKALALASPSTSKYVFPEKDVSKTRKFLNFILFIWGAFESSIVSLTILINKRTKEFRHVLTEMNIERKILKENTNYTEGVRLGANKIWNPIQNYRDIIFAKKDKKVNESHLHYNIYIKLFRATWFLILSHTELLSYFIIILNQVLRANFISFPAVLMIFCWGSLMVPKPTRTYWVVIISYVLIMLFIKNLFVMDIIPWKVSSQQKNLFFPPAIIGLNRHTNITLNVVILMILFFHRVVLQMLGLWKPFDYRAVTLINEGEYVLKDKQLLLVANQDTLNKNLLEVKSVEISFGDYFPNSIMHGFGRYAEGFKLFIQQLIMPSNTQLPVDVYTPMFFCDLVNLCLIIFFYGSFWKEETDEGFVDFIINNDVPISFLIVVLMYFFLMVLDRAFYLRKSRFNKIIFHFFQVIAVHIYFFILYPIVTERSFVKTPVVQFFYLFKCLYFLLSAYQIRNGYPSLISFHCLWHSTNRWRRYAYKFYNFLPYFFEMRTLLNWICTDSSLGINDWFTMEDIASNIYDNKCQDTDDDSPGDQPQNRTKKYLVGGFLYFLLIFTLIFPFMLFSLGSTVGIATHPTKFEVNIYMGSAEPIFHSYAFYVERVSEDNYINLTRTFNNIKEAESIFGNFEPEDVVVVKWSPHSLTQWKVSPGTHAELMKDLEKQNRFKIRVEIHFSHIGHGDEKTQSIFGRSTQIPPLPHWQRQDLINALNSTGETKPIWLPKVFPKFLMIAKDGKPKVMNIIKEPTSAHTDVDEQNSHSRSDDDDDDDDDDADLSVFRSLLVTLKTGKNKELWWHAIEECLASDDDYFYYLKNIHHNSCDELVMFTFNEKVFSKAISYITQSGIIGLYLLYFMLMVNFMKDCRVTVDEIWIDALPDSDDLWRKCKEVYIARDMQNYELEEELFAELIFIMRSREVLIKLTREKNNSYNAPNLTIESKKTK